MEQLRSRTGREELVRRARQYLDVLSGVVGGRRTGSPGNREAVRFFADAIGQHTAALETPEFPVPDHVAHAATLTNGNDQHFEVFVSPYSLGCDVEAELVAAPTRSALESRQPAAIVAATSCSPDQVGALYPFPFFVDGDFDIPSVYCTDVEGARLAALAEHARQPELRLRIDAYENTPGASDNASGTVVLLLCGGRKGLSVAIRGSPRWSPTRHQCR